MKIDGKLIAQKIIEELKKQKQPDKILAAVLVGSTGSPQVAQSKSFLRQKELMAKELGIVFELFQFGEDILEDDLISEIKKISADPEIGGIIVQLPLPPHFNRDRILAAVDPKKDVDALTSESKKFANPLPVEVVKDIIRDTNIRMHTNDTNNANIVEEYLKDKVVAVVGRGFLVGKPIADWLQGKCKELIILHSKSGLKELKKANLVITGVGKAGLIKPEMLKEGVGVIDFGYSIGKSQSANRKSKIFGDLDAERLAISDSRLAFYTPTPGGTGPILVAEIFKNFYKLTYF